ncbi:hypothetical protein D3C84_1018150 [compost metagenome]
MLAVVLVVQHRLQALQALGEAFPRRSSGILGAVGVAAPVEVDLGQLGAALPVAFLYRALHAGAIGTGLGAEDAPAGLQPGILGCQALGGEARAFLFYPCGQGVQVFWLV